MLGKLLGSFNDKVAKIRKLAVQAVSKVRHSRGLPCSLST